MFNFLFDGKIGELLAPVTGTSNQFHLAIQHHKNAEVQELLNTSPNLNLCLLSESGVAPIHIACRYNNSLALELILGRGVPVDLPDSQGNSPLHYASKYGNLEICKYLVSAGAIASSQNVHKLSPYDVTDNHVIRQFLLPLQFKNENEFGGGYSSAGYSTDQSYAHNNVASYGAAPYNQLIPTYNQPTSHAYIPPPAPQNASPSQLPGPNNVFSKKGTTGEALSVFTSTPGALGQGQGPVATTVSGPIVQLPSGGHLPHQQPQQLHAPPASTSHIIPSPATGTATPVTPSSHGQVHNPQSQPHTASSRMIQPDGFHSSSSDPALQLKYGHIKQEINIAPPPIASTAGQYSLYGSSNTAPHNVHSRYVGYDPINNAPLAYSAPQPYNATVYNSPSQVPPPALPSCAASPGNAPVIPPPPAPGLSHKGLLAVTAPLGPPTGLYLNPGHSQSNPNVTPNIFNPATDLDVVNLDASSSALL